MLLKCFTVVLYIKVLDNLTFYVMYDRDLILKRQASTPLLKLSYNRDFIQSISLVVLFNLESWEKDLNGKLKLHSDRILGSRLHPVSSKENFFKTFISLEDMNIIYSSPQNIYLNYFKKLITSNLNRVQTYNKLIINLYIDTLFVYYYTTSDMCWLGDIKYS